MEFENKMLKIGLVVNTFGIKGVIKLKLDQNIEIIGELLDFRTVFYQNKNSSFLPLKIETLQIKNNILFIKFENLNNINDVLKLKNNYLYVYNDQSFFIQRLNYLTFSVLTNHDQKGKIIDVMFNGIHDLIKVNLDGETKEFWVPIVDQFINQIDWEQKNIYLKNIEGLK